MKFYTLYFSIIEKRVKSDSYDVGRTILITQLSEDTTSKQLRVRCRKVGSVESLEYPVPGEWDLNY